MAATVESDDGAELSAEGLSANERGTWRDLTTFLSSLTSVVVKKDLKMIWKDVAKRENPKSVEALYVIRPARFACIIQIWWHSL